MNSFYVNDVFSSQENNIYQKGKSEIEKGNFLHAITLINSALEKYNFSNNLKGKADCYNALGYIYQQKSEFEEAKTYYQIAIQLKQELKDTMSLGITILNLAQTFYQDYDYVKSLEKYYSACLLFKDTTVQL